MEITEEQLRAALESAASSVPQAPTIRLEIEHGGVDRKNKSRHSEKAYREAIRKAIVTAKVRNEWPHAYNESSGGKRVTKAEIHISAFNSRSWGSESASVLRYELSGRFGLYDERSSGEVVSQDKKRDMGEPRIVVTVKALEMQDVPSWAQRVEAGEVGNEPDLSPFGICICGHVHKALSCEGGECDDFVRDPSVAAPFIAGSFNDPAAQKPAPREDGPAVQGIRDEDPSPEDVADRDAQLAILERMMRGDAAIRGGGGSKGRVRRDKHVKRDPQSKYDQLLQDDGLRPDVVAGRVQVSSKAALTSQQESAGEIFDDIGQRLALLGANGFARMAQFLDTVAPRADRVGNCDADTTAA